MCIDLNVSLPTVNKFLLLYSLRCGSIFILFWTALRTFICVSFIIIAIPEVLTGGDPSFSQYPLITNMTTSAEHVYFVYLSYIVMLVAEAVLFAFSTFDLLSGVFHQASEPIRQFLVCRLLTWMLELAILFVLSLIHGVLIGWYLIMLMLIILEFYGFDVVYSYYRELMEEEALCRGTCRGTCRGKTWDDTEML